MIHNNQIPEINNGKPVVSNRREPRLLRAIVLGNFRVVYQPVSMFQKVHMQLTKQGSYVQRTPHFLFMRNLNDRLVTLVHCFSPTDIDNNVGHYIMQELAPKGLIESDQAFGSVLIGIVTSVMPDDPLSAWGIFSHNTLERLRAFIDNPPSIVGEQNFVTSFASIYHRLLSLIVGSSLLDVGCACAFWPVLVSEYSHGYMNKIVGVDNRQEAVNLSSQLALLAQSDTVYFQLADVLSAAFPQLGTFDTVTAIHLLEHIPDHQTHKALENLLKVTRHRLIIAVPFEVQPEVAFGHEQTFSPQKLELLGKWSINYLNSKGSIHFEELHGGLLIVEVNTL